MRTNTDVHAFRLHDIKSVYMDSGNIAERWVVSKS